MKRSGGASRGAALVWTFLAMAGLAAGAGPELEQARKYYNITEFEKSLQVLESIAAKDADAYALAGRDYYMLADYKKATEALEKAVAAEPANAEYLLWTGRAYGRRAETSSPLTAPGNAAKARRYFERAVEANPKYTEALNDLFEYYLEAPGFLGGGLDKAQAVLLRIARLDAAEGHWAEARMAEKRKEYRHAEEQFRRAIEAAPREVGRFIDLARFLAGQGRFQEADQSFAKAERIAPGNPSLMYARADLYIKSGKNLQLARDLLQRYMSSTLTPDDPPRAEAAKLLRQVQGS